MGPRYALTRAASSARPRRMRVHWMHCGGGDGNFGDRITPLLLDHLGLSFSWAPINGAELVGVGSLLQDLPHDFDGMVWTSGLIAPGPTRSIPNASIVAVRGNLTLD